MSVEYVSFMEQVAKVSYSWYVVGYSRKCTGSSVHTPDKGTYVGKREWDSITSWTSARMQ